MSEVESELCIIRYMRRLWQPYIHNCSKVYNMVDHKSAGDGIWGWNKVLSFRLLFP